jgi:hypothetical protein
MVYHVPADEEVLAAARDVLREAKNVVSQREMRRLVLLELRRTNKESTLGGERMRRLLATNASVRVEVRTRRGPREKILNRCPVCGSSLRKEKNQTLFGGEVTLTLRCSQCQYWTGKEKRIPTLYTFHYQGRDAGAASTRAAADDVF